MSELAKLTVFNHYLGVPLMQRVPLLVRLKRHARGEDALFYYVFEAVYWFPDLPKAKEMRRLFLLDDAPFRVNSQEDLIDTVSDAIDKWETEPHRALRRSETIDALYEVAFDIMKESREWVLDHKQPKIELKAKVWHGDPPVALEWFEDKGPDVSGEALLKRTMLDLASIGVVFGSRDQLKAIGS